MSEFEEKYIDLVSKIRVIDMMKIHYSDLKEKQGTLNMEILNLERNGREIISALNKHQTNKIIKTITSSLKTRYIEKENELMDKHLSLILEARELKKLSALIQFELEILDEKLLKGEMLNKWLSELLQSGWKKISQIKSEKLKFIVTKRYELQKLIELKVEFTELICEGEKVLKLLKEIHNKINKDLVKEVRIDSNTPVFRTYCSNVLDEICKSAINLQLLFNSYSKEYSDIYENEKWEIEVKESKKIYFNTLSFAELIIKKIKENNITKNLSLLIKKAISKVIQLNNLFDSELIQIEEKIINKEKELNSLHKIT